MADKPAQAFLSYAHADDEYLNGGITWLCQELQRAMGSLTGDQPFEIFQDKDAIAFGEHWPSRIEDALAGARFLIPVLSPSYFASPNCRAEAEAFIALEARAKKRDRILPIYLIEADVFENPTRRQRDPIAGTMHQRQYFDWRENKFKLRETPRIKQRVFDMARQIKEACVPPPVADQQKAFHFWINEDAKIDRAPDDAPDVADNDLGMLAQQAGLQDACKRFLDPFRKKGRGQNFFERPISLVSDYEQAIAGPLSEIDYGDVWRLGSRLQNAWEAVAREMVRMDDPPPELEDEQQAALTDLLTEHAPFVLGSSIGRSQQARYERFQATKAELEAKEVEGQALNAIVQADDDLYTEPAKQLIAEVSAKSEQGDHPERDTVTAETTYQNLLSITGKAARFVGTAAAAGVVAKVSTDVPLGRELANLSTETIEAATRFLTSHEMVLKGLAAASGEGLAWLPELLNWVKVKVQSGTETKGPPPAPAIVTNDFWTPGRVFRDINEPWCPEMVVVTAGEFIMGSPEDEEGRFDNEGPQRHEIIKNAFALGRFPATFDAFDHFCDRTDREKPGDEGMGRGQRPVINVFWQDSVAYCDWLSDITGNAYRLPTEVEWEYACRAGTRTAYAFGDHINMGDANFGNRIGKTLEVGAYAANAFGLYDMHGNVWEWCDDRYWKGFEGPPARNRDRIRTLSERVIRGGSWVDLATHARSACRDKRRPNSPTFRVGFRCARHLD